jgi:hypothetical protein
MYLAIGATSPKCMLIKWIFTIICSFVNLKNADSHLLISTYILIKMTLNRIRSLSHCHVSHQLLKKQLNV